MLRSMTGYGRAEAMAFERRFVVEIKSVNHRYNDISIKLPRVLNPFEESLRKSLATRISRGKTDVYVSMESLSKKDIKLTFNENLADAFVEQLRHINTRYALDDSIRISDVSRFPDIISVDKNNGDDGILHEMWEGLSQAAELALERFISMREAEGEALRSDLLEKSKAIRELIRKIEKRSPDVVLEYRQKLKTRLDELLENVNVDEARLLTEITIFADRSCIDEELTRLDSHVDQLDAILQDSGVGRKLDFLVQEMNREVNTIGSKSNDIEITRIVVDLKAEIEKIREQVQNIE